jgi:hypothetical protein
MATVARSLYDDLLDVLAESVDARRLREFRLPVRRQLQVDRLLEKNRRGTISRAESAELDEFERFEHVVRMLKARSARKTAR